MLKKLVIACLAVAVGLFVLKRTELGSYVRVWWKNARACASKQVPIETEIERLRDDVARLGGETRGHFDAIAEEEVAIDNLQGDIKHVRANLERQERNIRTMREDLKSDVQFITYGDTQYTRRQVEHQLKHDWAAFKRAENELKVKENLLEAKKDALNAAKDKLQAMQDTRDGLAQKLETLEAELRSVRVAQTRSKLHFDDNNSALASIKEGVAKVENRIKVERKKLEHEAEFTSGPVRVDQKSAKDFVKEIDAHFKGKASNSKVAVETEN
jgi:peptidoglycan hydrolase CwlO-like protein